MLKSAKNGVRQGSSSMLKGGATLLKQVDPRQVLSQREAREDGLCLFRTLSK